MWFPIGDLFNIGSILCARAQACQLFGNDLMATYKSQKKQIWI